MIGKMYRPIQVLNIPNKRGYKITHKYKSNYAGGYKFEQEVYLEYNDKKSTEKLCINMINLEIPVLFTQLNYKEDPIFIKKDGGTEYVIENFEKEPINNKTLHTIESLRKISRPTNISSKNNLEFVFVLISNKNPSENDIVEIEMFPTIANRKEYMRIIATGKIPIKISANTTIKYV